MSQSDGLQSLTPEVLWFFLELFGDDLIQFRPNLYQCIAHAAKLFDTVSPKNVSMVGVDKHKG